MWLKIKKMLSKFEKREILAFCIFVLIVATVFIGMTFYRDTFEVIGAMLLVIELAIFITVTWALAGHAVMKSLFVVGASLSLMIFLAQSYCAAPHLTQAGNEALKSLLGFSLLYLGFDFIRSLYKEVTGHTKRMKEINKGKNPWIFLVPFALFVGIFLWQLYQVMFPIVSSLCIK